jgi:hypothetical protein
MTTMFVLFMDGSYKYVSEMTPSVVIVIIILFKIHSLASFKGTQAQRKEIYKKSLLVLVKQGK